MRGLVFLMLFTLFGCDIRVSEAKKHIKDMLNDPDSGQFQDVRVVNYEPEKHLVCGKVNAKNAFGAYVGFHDFVYLSEGVVKDYFIVPVERSLVNDKKQLKMYAVGCKGMSLEKFEDFYKNESETWEKMRRLKVDMDAYGTIEMYRKAKDELEFLEGVYQRNYSYYSPFKYSR